MTGKKKNDSKAEEQKTIQETLKLELAIFETLKQEIPTRILLLLLTYPELSLTQLSDALGKSKATVLRHTKSMIERNVLMEYSKDGSRSKYFRRNSKHLSLSTPEIVIPFVGKMTQEERRDLYNSLIATEKSLLLLMKYSIDLTIKYMDIYGETKRNVEVDEKMIASIFEEMEVLTYWDLYNQDTRKIYEKHHRIFRENMQKEFEKYHETKGTEESDFDYMMWSMLIPLKQVLKWSSRAF